MPETVFGLPLHPLIVHATVVFVPLAALALALSVLSPRFRAWAGILPLGLTVAAVVLAPLSTSTGENLEHVVGENSLVRKHAELGEGLIWWCIGMVVVAGASYLLRRRDAEPGKRVSAALLAVGVLVAGGTLVQTVLIGHSGAKAAWGDVAQASSTSASSDSGDGD
jgi:hypothetical protein